MIWLRQFITGFFIGLANLIPGVSGGTFALILGVYERLISFLNSISLRHLANLTVLVRHCVMSGFAHDKRTELRKFLIDNDYPFMALLGCGALFCILAMSSLMKYLLLNHFMLTYAYFFGLIVLSVVIPWRMVKQWKLSLFTPLLAGIFLTIFLTASVNPYDKALNKSELLAKQYHSQQVTTDTSEKGKSSQPSSFSYTGKYTFVEYFYIFLCGVVAISAMVLPGVSGSLVLILMGQYFAVISAIANIGALLLDDLFFLCAMALGIVIGLLSFARIIEFAFKRYHDPMVSFLVGLILGSLYALWPFKQPEIIPAYYVKEGTVIEIFENYTVYSNVNILPSDWHTALLAAAVVLAGMLSMVPFLRQDKPI